MLTGFLYKDQLLVKHITKASKVRKGSSTGSHEKGKAKTTTKPRVGRRQGVQCTGQEREDDRDDEWPCLICGEPFVRSRSNEVWVQCMCCGQWAHEESTAGDMCFVCPNSDSDS